MMVDDGKKKDKAPKWAWWLLSGLSASVAIIIIIVTTPSQPPRAAVAEKPICDGSSYRFNDVDVNEIQVPLRPECWSGWVDIPPDAASYDYEISSGDGWHERWQWNGEKFFSGKGAASWRPIRLQPSIKTGTFRLRGESEDGYALVRVERR